MFARSSSTDALRVVALSVLALVAGIGGAALAPETAADVETQLWILAVIPGFLLAYHRGWRGVATVLAVVMVVLALAHAGFAWLGVEMQRTGPALRLALIGIATTGGVAVLAEMLQRARARAERLELQDPVTGLPNERHLAMVLERECAAAGRDRPLSVVIFQVDGLRQYQRRFGPAAAEEWLQALALAVRKETRRMNFSARFGDRFVSVLSSGGVEGARVFARSVQTSFAYAVGIGRRVSASAGIVAYHPKLDSPRKLLQAADFALSRAEQLGPGSAYVHEFEPAKSGRDLPRAQQTLQSRPA